MSEAARLTQAGRLTEATAALQKNLPSVLPKLPETLRNVLGRLQPNATPTAAAPRKSEGRFIELAFAGPTGGRSYKLYTPAALPDGRVPLVVMLHGCTQSPDDFALGTRMNAAADAHGFLVAYPAQTSAANMQRCWNWFNAADQQRDLGEPSIVAGITRAVMRERAIDPRRVYVAGLSAGGALAAVLGQVYPDLYAAVGVHSGLACGAARDMQSAFAAMQRGGAAVPRSATAAAVPAIVFHGDRDGTVNPRNGEQVVEQFTQGAAFTRRMMEGRVPGGEAWSRICLDDAAGRTMAEQWTVHGAGHAWSGGSPEGSYTDPKGPDATAEMVRFFSGHSLGGAAA